MDLTVVGAGVVGLTAAVTLTEAGHDVRVIAAATGDATTSSVAGAIWLPFECGPRDRVNRWAARTRTWLEQLAASTPAAGVAMLDVVQIAPEGEDGPPWWADAVGELQRAPAPVAGRPMAWHFRAPRVDPRRHLPWLTSRLHRPIELARVGRLADVPGDVVINATGLGARVLAADDSLRALYGQVLVTAPGTIDVEVTLSDDRDPLAMFYVIPRGDELVIGGCALPRPDDDPLAPDPAIRARIEGQAAALGLSPGAILRQRAGLRPARPTVRVERDPADPRIVHDYGHGGAGFTLARGCALDVLAMLD